ncbi:MAG: response regulator [Candidatus Methylacidiphilales bacterium]
MYKIKTICIINDDDIFTFILKKSITKLNVCGQVITFSNGQEAMDAFSISGAVVPEIILLDINMPIMDGWGFLSEFEIIKTNEKVDIYLISAHVSDEDCLKVKTNKRITGILSDPTDNETIMKIVNEY